MKWNFNIKRWKTPLVLTLILLGILVRLLYLGTMPDGINQDEAMAAYESYSLLKTGVDISGYHNPVYLEAWGDGMNALETYLMMPAISVFGLEIFAIRLPQALIGCLCLPVFYLLLKRLSDEKTALIGLLLLAMNPWHIMMCRWALESNLAPAFLLFGLYFFVLGLQKHPAYYLLSALCYGLSLYTYAILWLIVPIVVGCQILYALFSKNARITGWTIGIVLLLFLFALPLILLMLINQGSLPEIKASWLSIPGMFGWRSGDLVLRNLIRPGSYLQLLKLFLRQTDDTVFG
ncbi:MAG: glycosyltransferase family 39 protein, partial [Christensenella sp.]